MYPIEFTAAKARHHDAEFVRIFTIIGMKGDENPETAVFKARSVAQGNTIHDTDFEQVHYSDVSSSSTTMGGIRSVVSYGEVIGTGSSTGDAMSAFVQPDLDPAIHLYAYLPDDLMNDEQRALCKLMKKPVFRLRKPIYGLPRFQPVLEQAA